MRDPRLSESRWRREPWTELVRVERRLPAPSFCAAGAGAWCAIAEGTSSTPEQIGARHREIDAACDTLDALGGPWRAAMSMSGRVQTVNRQGASGSTGASDVAFGVRCEQRWREPAGCRHAFGCGAAAHHADDDGGPDGFFGAPVGGVDRRVPQEGKEYAEVDGQVATKHSASSSGGGLSISRLIWASSRPRAVARRS